MISRAEGALILILLRVRDMEDQMNSTPLIKTIRAGIRGGLVVLIRERALEEAKMTILEIDFMDKTRIKISLIVQNLTNHLIHRKIMTNLDVKGKDQVNGTIQRILMQQLQLKMV